MFFFLVPEKRIKKYAQKIEADLVVIGVLVENIERNKVAFRETLHPYTKKRLLTPKPYFEINKEKLELKNTPVPKNKIKINDVDPKKVQWEIIFFFLLQMPIILEKLLKKLMIFIQK